MHQSEGNHLAATSELKVMFMSVGSELEVGQQSGRSQRAVKSQSEANTSR